MIQLLIWQPEKIQISCTIMLKTYKQYFKECVTYMGLCQHLWSVCFTCRTVLYECCPGYMKMEGMRGCPAGTVC